MLRAVSKSNVKKLLNRFELPLPEIWSKYWRIVSRAPHVVREHRRVERDVGAPGVVLHGRERSTVLHLRQGHAEVQARAVGEVEVSAQLRLLDVHLHVAVAERRAGDRHRDGLTPLMPAGSCTLMTGKSWLKSAVVLPRTKAATPSTEFEPYGLSAPDSALESW